MELEQDQTISSVTEPSNNVKTENELNEAELEKSNENKVDVPIEKDNEDENKGEEEEEDKEKEENNENGADDNAGDLKPISYLNRGEYSSERFKLEIKNLPKTFGFGQIKKFFHSIDLKFVKLKSPGNSGYAFVTFKDENARDEALQLINKTIYKGKQLEAILAKPAADPLTCKRKNKNSTSDDYSKEKKIKTNESQSDLNKTDETPLTLEERVQNSTTPLWNLSYEKQCEQKKNSIKQILRKCLFKMQKLHKETFFWLQTQSKNNEGMCCELSEFVDSPVVDNYRNKCEFTIGYNVDETKRVVGFRLGEYKNGSNEVVEPYCCKNFSDAMKSLIKKFQEYIDKSIYKPFNVRTHEGHWSQLTLRSNQNNELLAILIFVKQDLTDEEINKEKQLLIEYFKETETSEESTFKLKSLLFNLNPNKSGISKMDNLDVLIGQDFLYESLLDLKFRISPLAFFQANTKGAEVLYKKIGEICQVDESTIILDICCGTGTIGLTLAKKAKLVIGVEMVAQSIEDAKLNSELNGIKNVEFYCGKAEDILPNLLKRFTNEKVVAIVDPPRAGLHNKVIQALRRLKNLESLIYVSCNPELAMGNFVDLSRDTSRHYVFQPFVPIKAIAVDMFPHTTHCELILYFKRYSNELMIQSNNKQNN